MKIALFPGSFDPFTVGHQAIVERALPLFDKIIIAFGVNIGKKPYQPLEDRVAKVTAIYGGDSKVEVVT